MDLPNNIIKHFLKNVYFVSGCACGGKSTISKYLSQNHKIALYNWSELEGDTGGDRTAFQS